ncbi:MAG: hypothetical protein HN931_04210 [Desulfobacterales bacterium]|nr:hypothetical protein [Desulfobacterales bacterium]
MGRKLGMSDDEISKLANISKSDFEFREWVALNYVRGFAALGGQEPVVEHIEDFHSLYSENEQKHILRVAIQMDFTNRLVSTITRKKPSGPLQV